MDRKQIGTLVAALGLLVILLIGYMGYRNGLLLPSRVEAQDEDTGDVELDDLENVIWASGNLEPVEWARLSSRSSGLVQEIHVSEGQEVSKDTVLLTLANEDAQADVLVAEAAVAEAQASLDQLLATATEAEVASAQAHLASAEAAVLMAAGRMLELQAGIESAQALVRVAEAEYGVLASPPTQIRETAAEANVEVAQAAVRQAQAAYNLVQGDPQIGARPESRALYEATAALEAAQAQAALSLSGATNQQLAAALATIDSTKAQLMISESQTSGVEGEMQAAMAQRKSAQAALNMLLNGATAEDVAMSQARLQSAQAALTAAKARLDSYQVMAPFDGQVGIINTRVGEVVLLGDMLFQFGNTNRLHIRTTDLRETDVIHLSLNMPVEVSFDALPDQIFQGTITQIAPVSNTDRGSTSYTVQIDVPNLDQRLRWGMTAFVNISIGG
ncbi:MAG: efflux RND transporter periplasmic adaptor subunit [Chloroflexota bacterium]